MNAEKPINPAKVNDGLTVVPSLHLFVEQQVVFVAPRDIDPHNFEHPLDTIAVSPVPATDFCQDSIESVVCNATW